jgi:hypothetical protein
MSGQSLEIIEQGQVTVVEIGLPGVPGTKGAPGTSWIDGYGEPLPAQGLERDHYLDHASGDVWAKGPAGWAKTGGNLTGPRGLQGLQGIKGDTGDITPELQAARDDAVAASANATQKAAEAVASATAAGNAATAAHQDALSTDAWKTVATEAAQSASGSAAAASQSSLGAAASAASAGDAEAAAAGSATAAATSASAAGDSAAAAAAAAAAADGSRASSAQSAAQALASATAAVESEATVEDLAAAADAAKSAAETARDQAGASASAAAASATAASASATAAGQAKTAAEAARDRAEAAAGNTANPVFSTVKVKPAAGDAPIVLVPYDAASGAKLSSTKPDGETKRWEVDLAVGATDDFQLNRFSDAGAVVDAPLAVKRATGEVTITGAVTVKAVAGAATNKLSLDRPALAGQDNVILSSVAGKALWSIVMGNTAGGAYAMSFARYSSADGSYVDTPITINNTNGVVVIPKLAVGANSGDVGSAWEYYSCPMDVTAGSLSTWAATLYYKIMGKVAFLTLEIYIGSGNPTGAYRVYLPFNAAYNQTLSGRENSLNGRQLQAWIAANGNVLTIFDYANSNPGGVGARLLLTGSISIL